MRSPIEVVNKKLILPLSLLRTEFGFTFLYFGLLLGIKASDILDNPWLLGLWVFLLLGTLYLDLSRPGIRSTSPSEEHAKPPHKNTNTLSRFGVALASVGITTLLMNFSESFFFRVESLFRIIHYGDSLANWILLSFILVTTHLLGALVAFRKTDTAPYARLFPLLALLLVYLKGVI
jgi:hypothetical protein